MDPNDDKDADAIGWTWAALEPEPTESERELLDRFCVEYLRDGIAGAAASRCGFSAGFAKEYGERFLKRSYVTRRLQFLKQQASELTPKEQAKHDLHMSLTALREVVSNQYTPGNVRVAAATQLINYHTGGTKAGKTPGSGQPGEVARGGVMSVPAIANLDEWEAAATKSQQALAEVSRV